MIENIIQISVKNKIQPIHWHDLLEIIVVVKGEVEITRTNESIVLAENDIFVLNREDIHFIKSVSSDSKYIQLTLDVVDFEQFIPGISKLIFRCGPDQNDIVSEKLKTELREHISRVIKGIEEKHVNEQLVVYSCIEILNILKLGFLGNKTAKTKRKSAEQLDRLWKIIDFMYDSCMEKLMLKDVAAHVFVSEAYVSLILKEETGKSFEDFLAFIRAETSIHYLMTTDMSVTNIAYECGFSAPRYYNLAFQKYYDCTPKEYREKNRDFFNIERKANLPYITFDEGIDKKDLIEWVSKYENHTREDVTEVSKINITIHLDDPLIGGKERAKKDLGIVTCTESDFVYYGAIGALKACIEELGIKTFVISDATSGHIADNIKRIAAGLTVEVVSGKDAIKNTLININELFLKNGIKTNAYYRYIMRSDVRGVISKLHNSCDIYKRGDVISILLDNDSYEDRKFIVAYLLGEENNSYVLKEEIVHDISDKELEALEKVTCSNSEMSKVCGEILKPKSNFNIYLSGKPILKEVNLKKGEICCLSLYKLF